MFWGFVERKNHNFMINIQIQTMSRTLNSFLDGIQTNNHTISGVNIPVDDNSGGNISGGNITPEVYKIDVGLL